MGTFFILLSKHSKWWKWKTKRQIASMLWVLICVEELVIMLLEINFNHFVLECKTIKRWSFLHRYIFRLTTEPAAICSLKRFGHPHHLTLLILSRCSGLPAAISNGSVILEPGTLSVNAIRPSVYFGSRLRVLYKWRRRNTCARPEVSACSYAYRQVVNSYS